MNTNRTNTVKIHIDGLQGSGKSRVADIISEALRAQGVQVTVHDGERIPQPIMRMAPDHAVSIHVEQK